MGHSTAQLCRHAAGYHPGKTFVEYEKPKLHHVVRWPQYEQHTRFVRAWDPKLRQIVAQAVTKVIMSADGRTPRKPILVLVKDPQTQEQRVEPQTELAPVQAPIRLKVGTPKWQYRQLKKLERRVGLVQAYKQIRAAV